VREKGIGVTHSSIKVLPEALLESLGHGLFNLPDAHQIEVLTELDSVNQFEAIRTLLQRDLSWSARLLSELFRLKESAWTLSLWLALKTDPALDQGKLKQMLKKKKQGQSSLWEALEQLSQHTSPREPATPEFKYLARALANTVQDYRETQVGQNLMDVSMHLPLQTRQQLWETLNPAELYLLAVYLPNDVQRQQYWLDLPLHQLVGVLHEMKRAERIQLLDYLLRHGEMPPFEAALKGLYHMPDGISEFSDTRPVSEQGETLKRLFQKRPELKSMSPELLAHAVYILSEEDQDRCISSLFKRGELSKTQVLAIDARFRALLGSQEPQTPGAGLKHLIERMHNHEGLWSLSRSTSRSSTILDELERLGLLDLKTVCEKAAI
jgi:hypothetical protein